MEQESLSDILAGSSALVPATPEKPATDVKPSEPATPEPEAAAPSAAKEPESKPDPARDENGRFTKPEAKAEPDKGPKPEPMVPLSALLAERAKRQQPQEAPKAKPSVFEDEGKALEAYTSEANAPLREAIFEMSVEMARMRHQDFDDVAKTFAEAAEADPRLWEQMRGARNPAAYLYSVGLQIRELSDVGGDIVRYRDKVTAASKAELTAKDERIKALEAELAAAKKPAEPIPRSLNTTASGAAPRSTDADPEDIRNIVRFKSG